MRQLLQAVIAGGKYSSLTWYVKNVEPYFEDAGLYAKFQMLTYLYYFVPYYVLAIYGLVVGGQNWMPDWSLIHAGAAMQVSSTDYRKYAFRRYTRSLISCNRG